MYQVKNALCLIGIAATLVLTGCGGGGGGSSTTTPTLPAVSALEANATADNGLKALNTLIYGTSTGIPIPLSVPATTLKTSFDPVQFTLDHTDDVQKVFKSFDATGNAISTTSITPSATLFHECLDGGTISYVINSQSTTHADVTFIFDNCAEYGETTNGKMRIIADSPDGGYTLTYMKIFFVTNFTISNGSSMMMYAGSFLETTFTSYDGSTGAASGTTTSSAQWTVNNSETGRYDNLTSQFNDDGGYGAHDECYKMGRLYIDNLTYYLDINSSYDPYCNDPFTWQNYILTSGSMQLIGADSKVVDVNVTSDNNITITDSFGGSANLLL